MTATATADSSKHAAASVTVVLPPQTTIPFVFAQEFHIWWRTPKSVSGQPATGLAETRPWHQWDGSTTLYDPEESVLGSTWLRQTVSEGYPLIGPFDSREIEILRWDMRLARSAGISGLGVSLWHQPDGSFSPEYLTTFGTALTAAASEGMKLSVWDEVHFSPAAQPRAVMTPRVIDALRRFKDHAAYLRIDGKPVYQFVFDGSRLGGYTASDLEQLFSDVEAAVGPVCWWLQGLQATDLSNAHVCVRETTPHPPTNAGTYDREVFRSRLRNDLTATRAALRHYALNIFPGFAESRFRIGASRSLPRNGGATLTDQLAIANEERVEMVIISSWNDWQENTAITPGWIPIADSSSNPYRELNTIATFTAARVFASPALPAIGSIDSLMHGRLFGIDHAGPFLIDAGIAGDSLVSVRIVDDLSNVAGAEAYLDGWQWLRLGKVDVASNLQPIYVGDGITTVVTRAGRLARATNGSTSRYVYVKDPAFSSGVRSVDVAVEYFDEGTGQLFVEYTSPSSAYTRSAAAELTNSLSWKVHVFRLPNATFAGTQNGNADFRVGSAEPLTLSRIAVLGAGSGIAASPADGAFDSHDELVHVRLRIPNDNDSHLVFLRGRDAAGNWSTSWNILHTP